MSGWAYVVTIAKREEYERDPDEVRRRAEVLRPVAEEQAAEQGATVSADPPTLLVDEGEGVTLEDGTPVPPMVACRYEGTTVGG